MDIPQGHTAISLLRRYRIVAPSALKRAEAKPVERELTQLQSRGIVSRWRHASGLTYWTRRSPGPLANHALGRAHAQFSYCPPWGARHLLTVPELERLLRPYGCQSTASGYYCERSADNFRLGRLRVDTGSRLSRLVAASARSIDRLRQSDIRQLIDDHGFELTWIVATEAKRRRLMQALQPLGPSGVSLRVVALPELLGLLAPLRPN